MKKELLITLLIITIFLSSCGAYVESQLPRVNEPYGDKGPMSTMIIKLSLQTPIISQSSLQDDILEFMQSYYGNRGGIVRRTQYSEEMIKFHITKIAQEIIPEANYWEEIEVVLDIETEQSVLKIKGFVDGRYAAGLINLPASGAYKDMEPQYTKQLNDYTGELLFKLKGYLKSKGY